MEMEQSYFTVVPLWILQHKELTPNAKLVYGIISSLTRKSGYCYASNSYIADVLNSNATSVSKFVNQLAKLGCITIEYKYGKNKECIERRIYLKETEYMARPVSEENEESSDSEVCVTQPEPKKKKTFSYEQILNVCVKNNFKGMNDSPGKLAEWFFSVAHNEDGTLCYKGYNITSYPSLVSMLRNIDVNGKRMKSTKSNGGRSTTNESYF